MLLAYVSRNTSIGSIVSHASSTLVLFFFAKEYTVDALCMTNAILMTSTKISIITPSAIKIVPRILIISGRTLIIKNPDSPSETKHSKIITNTQNNSLTTIFTTSKIFFIFLSFLSKSKAINTKAIYILTPNLKFYKQDFRLLILWS